MDEDGRKKERKGKEKRRGRGGGKSERARRKVKPSSSSSFGWRKGGGAIIKMEGNELPSLSTPWFTIRFSNITALREVVPRF